MKNSKLDISFAEFFFLNPQTSRRLANAILRAADEADVVFPSVLDYWENRNHAQLRLLLVDGLGPKAVDELNKRIYVFLGTVYDEAAHEYDPSALFSDA